MIILILTIVGLCLGSFINALVWRLNALEIESSKKRLNLEYINDLSILNGRSMCTNCKHKLNSLDLIPIFSWIILRGRCRYCKHNISIIYPIVELTVAIIFDLTYICWPNNLIGIEIEIFALWLLVLTGFVALFYYDVKWYKLPTSIIYTLMPIGLIISIINISRSNEILKSIVSLLISILIGGGIFYAIYQLSDGKYIGGGDVRLGWLLGLLAGSPAKIILILFLASLIGSLFSITLIILKRLTPKSVIAFGPFLLTASYITLLFGPDILNWYKSLII